MRARILKIDKTSGIHWAAVVFGTAMAMFLTAMPANAATLTVDNLNDAGPGSLRQCLLTADTGDLIEFNAGVTGTLTLVGGSMNITSDVTIAGPGAELMTISGNSASRIFTATNVNISVSDLTFSDGTAGIGANGGLLYQAGGQMSFSNCVFRDGQSAGAEGLAGGFGGALYITGGMVTAHGCVFSNNAAVGPAGAPQDHAYYAGGGGGGAGLGGAVCVLDGTGTFFQCVFGSNSVTGGGGGRGGWDLPTTQDGGHGGGPAGGSGGVDGHADGYDGGEFSGGGGGKLDGPRTGGNGGFGGGGGGAGAYSPSAASGTGGTYAGNGSKSQSSSGGGGGGGAGLGGAVFIKGGRLVCSNSVFVGNAAAGGAGGNSAMPGGNGQGVGGAIFLYQSERDMGANEFTRNSPNSGDELIILGTNGIAIINDEPASVDKGADFGPRTIGTPVTNVLTVFNPATNEITILQTATNGAGAAAFRIAGLPATLPAGVATNLAVVFTPASTNAHACVFSIITEASFAPTNLINLAGTGIKGDQAITNFTPTNGATFSVTETVGLSAQADSGLPVSFAVAAGPGAISGGTNLSFTGAGTVSVVASQAGDATWNPAPNLTNAYIIAKVDQAALVFTPTTPQTYNTTRGLRATGGSGSGAVSFTVLAGPGQISGGTNLKVNAGTGTVTIRAAKAADAFYNAAAVTAQVACAKAAQTITFPAIPNQYTTSVVTLAATASSGLPVTFAIVSGPGVIANSTRLTFTGAGTVRIAARQTGNTNWNAAVAVTNTIQVLTPPPTHGSLQVVLSPADAMANGAMWRVDGGAWCISGTTLANLTVGSHVVTFSAVPGYNALAALTVTIRGNQVSTYTGQYTLTAGDARYTPMASDYDGDGKADPGIHRASDASWRWRMSRNGYAWFRYGAAYGGSGRVPVAADFDGDRLADIGLYNVNTGKWRARVSSAGYAEITLPGTLGGAGWLAVAADYDGDRKADPAVYNPTTGQWKMRLSSQGYQAYTAPYLLGGTGYTAAAGDVDGDGKADLCVCKMATGECQTRESARNYAQVNLGVGYLGQPGYLLMLADFDGDGKADPAVCDPATGTIKARLSASGYQLQTLTNFLKP